MFSSKSKARVGPLRPLAIVSIVVLAIAVLLIPGGQTPAGAMPLGRLQQGRLPTLAETTTQTANAPSRKVVLNSVHPTGQDGTPIAMTRLGSKSGAPGNPPLITSTQTGTGTATVTPTSPCVLGSPTPGQHSPRNQHGAADRPGSDGTSVYAAGRISSRAGINKLPCKRQLV